MAPLEELLQEALLTGDFGPLNTWYKENPPEYVLDSDSVRHQKEVPLPAVYELAPCACKTIHPLESDTWFHCGVKVIDDTTVAVYRACKTCGQVLTKKLVTN